MLRVKQGYPSRKMYEKILYQNVTLKSLQKGWRTLALPWAWGR